jgi:general secretion pathway protein E
MRLRDMGIEPFLLSSSISGVLSQRLVRRLCPACKQSYAATASELDLLAQQPSTKAVTLYRPCGCEECNHLGYKGRWAIFEIVPIDEQLQDMIHDGSGEHKMNDHVRSFCKSIRQSARDKVLQGATTIQEIVRAIQDY